MLPDARHAGVGHRPREERLDPPFHELALKAKGNHYRFIYAQGAGHGDNNARNQVMPEGLSWLWRGYKAK